MVAPVTDAFVAGLVTLMAQPAVSVSRLNGSWITDTDGSVADPACSNKFVTEPGSVL